LRAMKPLSVLPRQLSVGGRSVLFTDKSLIDEMHAGGYWIGDNIVQRILREAGE
jgi:predicted nucleic acid-binding protein